MRETITYNDVVSRLLAAIPEFHPDSEDVADNLVYLVFGDLIRFARQELEDPSAQTLANAPVAALTIRYLAYDKRLNEQ